jgi:uncharacterized protein YacL
MNLMKKTADIKKDSKDVRPQAVKTASSPLQVSAPKPTPAFTQALAREIVKNLVAIGQFTSRPFNRDRDPKPEEVKLPELGDQPALIDTSVLIDGRILSVVNSGFLTGTLIIPQFVLGEVQHIADSSDSLRRAKGRRGLDIVGKLKWQRVNPLLKIKIVGDDPADVKEVDHKLVALAKKWRSIPNGRHIRLITVDFNLAHLARVQGVAVLNINDIAQALKLSLVPGEELTIKISHEGKEREQGVGYLSDGTMVVVDNAKDKVGADLAIVVTKIHQTPAGQLFFARLR